MNYLEAVRWMFQRIPSYQEIGKRSYRPGLIGIKNFCIRLGNPHTFFKSIHIGGTNGKGSTLHMLYSILQEEGYKVGSFISPHLLDFRERISCNGKVIEKKFFLNFIKDHSNFIEKENISFFELNTALSFQYFKEKKVDIALIEVGMGGRLDSTNIIYPELSIITNVSIDHQEILGKKESNIALEKSGIIKKHTSVVIGRNNLNHVNFIFLQEAMKKNAPIYFTVPCKKDKKYTIPMKSIYQTFNKSLVLNSINVLNKRKNIFVSEQSIINGLKMVFKNTNFRGRWHILQKSCPRIICDISHNQEGIYMINLQLKKEVYKKLHLVLGFVREKKVETFLKYFPKNACYYFCQPNIKRKYTINNLKKVVYDINIEHKNIKFYQSVKQAFIAAQKQSDKEDLILISGSTFVISEIFTI